MFTFSIGTYDLISFGCIAHIKKCWVVLIYSLIPWVRPESYLLVPAAFILMAFSAFVRRDLIKGLILRIGIFVVSLAVLLIWRIAYFGYLLPNTYYAKVSPDFGYNLVEGGRYLCSYALNEVSLLLAIVSSVIAYFYVANIVGIFRYGNQNYRRWRCLGLWALILMFLPVLNGGDHFACFRFFQPAYPLECLLLSVVVSKLLFILRRQSARAAFLLLLLLFLILGIAFGWSGDMNWKNINNTNHRMRHEFVIAEMGRCNGIAINTVLSEMDRIPRIGVVCAGGIARTYKGEIVDLMGLNDVRIAHDGGNRMGMKNHAAFNLQEFPKYDVEMFPFSPNHTVDINGCPKLDEFNRMAFRAVSPTILQGLFEHPDFVSNWTCVKVANVKSGQHFVALVRNDIRLRVEALDDVFVTDYMVWNGSKWQM